MNSNIIRENLFRMKDEEYRLFQAKLIPTVNADNIIGVRTKFIRDYAKKLIKENNYQAFLDDLPHKYFDENQLHAFIISELKQYDKCITHLNKFLPYVDNWATCDQTSPKVFKKNLDKLLKEIMIWINSKKAYTIRFGINMLQKYFLDENFKEEYLKLVAGIKSDEYYVNMMISWYFSTALVKQYDKTIPFFENKVLDFWVHNKSIQKALESFRITKEKKDYLRKLKI